MIHDWPCPLPDGGNVDELCIEFKGDNHARLLLIPPLFDEHNKLRRQMVAIMRLFLDAGFDSVLPDLPGWNESLEPLDKQTFSGWRNAIDTAADHFQATHVIAVRSGALLVPSRLVGWLYAPVSGTRTLRSMIRARIIANREDGISETSDALHELGRADGLTLAGWPIGPELFRELEAAEVPLSENHSEISQSDIGGAGLWLRAEPDEDPVQANAIVRHIVEELARP